MMIIYVHVLLVLCDNTHSTVNEVFLDYDNKKYKKEKKKRRKNGPETFCSAHTFIHHFSPNILSLGLN